MVLVHVQAIGGIALALCILMGLAWVVQQRTGNSGWVDAIWSYATGLVGAVAALWPFEDGTPERRVLVATLALLWSVRLGTHIARRAAAGIDDPRYANYARQWGAAAPRRMFLFLQSQALVSVPLPFAIFLAAHAPEPGLRLQDYIGAFIILVAIAGEGLADQQLRRFKLSPCNTDLSATWGFGGGRDTPTISSSGWVGWLTRSSRSRPDTPGVGPAWRRQRSCTGSSCM
jgi:steroid 5-alpha reductase family enzyme